MRILFGITGSIAAIKTMDLIHKVVQLGHECKVIITKGGLNFVTPIALTSMGCDVFTDENLDIYKYKSVMEHINLARWAEHIIIVPASANTIAKLAHGLADNILNAAVLASTAPKVIVPAMNQQMWKAQVTINNVDKLIDLGFSVWGPGHGLQACGDIDVGRMLESDAILNKIQALQFVNYRLSGKKIVITAGGTIEYIDPVRYITNRSSGKMAYALAKTAVYLGADVVLISGRVDAIDKPGGIKTFHEVNSAVEMLKIANEEAIGADVFIGCAAVCDYRMDQISQQKIKSKSDVINLTLVKNPDIIATIKKNNPDLYTVGFAAETQNLLDNAIGKLKAKNLDLIVANDVSDGVFGSDFNQVTIVDRDLNQFNMERTTKSCIADKIFDKIIKDIPTSFN